MHEKNIKIGVNCFVFAGQKVLLGKRLGAAGSGSWGLPGGHLEYGEHLVEAAKRELFEETGLVAETLEFLQIVNDPREETHYVQINFLVTKWTGKLEIKEPGKCEECRWFKLNDLPEPLFFGHEKFFPAFSAKINLVS